MRFVWMGKLPAKSFAGVLASGGHADALTVG